MSLTARRGPDGRTRLARLRQAGSLRALFPRGGGAALEAVTLNTAGGLTGGDRMAVAARVEEGARLVLTTQAAERAYRALGGPPARLDAALWVGPGARLDWLPQELILYEGSRLDRRLRLDLAPDAAALVVEPLLVGRLRHGEDPRDLWFRDRWEVRRDGRLAFADRVALEGDAAARLDRAAVAGGARALATLLLAAPGAGARLGAVRALLPAGEATAGASALSDDLLVVRLLAPDGFALRRALVPVILALTGMALPKVWSL